MSARPFRVPSPEALAEVERLSERQLTADELAAYLRAPMSDAEREEILSLIAWFTRRYPTPGERLDAARKAYRDARALMPR